MVMMMMMVWFRLIRIVEPFSPSLLYSHVGVLFAGARISTPSRSYTKNISETPKGINLISRITHTAQP